jgi:integrase
MKGMIKRRGKTWTCYWYATDPQGVQRQRSKGGFPLKKAAQDHLNGVLTAISAGTYTEVQDKTMTVGTFLLDRWLPAARSGATKQGTPRRSNTLAQYEIAVRSWLVPHLGGVRLVALTPAHVEAALTALAASGGKGGRPLSGRSCQLAYGVLRMALAYGVRAGYCQRNVAELVDRPGAVSAEQQSWTAEQARAFLSTVADDPHFAAWAIFLTRGPRRGEVAGLRWSDVDLDAGTLRIATTRISIGGRVEESTPKTAAGKRPVPLDAGLVTILKAHRRRQLEAKMAAGPGWTESGHVFTREDGQPLHPEWFSRRFKVLCGRAGVPVIKLHGTRHTTASLMLAAGVNVKVVQELLGHASPAITQAVYSHVMPGQSEAAGEQLSGRLLG